MKLCHIAILLKILLNKLINMKRLFYNCAYGVEYQQIGDSVNYAFVEEGKTLYVYFQGSNSITDWVRNFLFAESKYKMFKVHKGFYQAYRQARNLLLDKIYERDDFGDYKWLKIVIVGYSHGGALCQIFFEDAVYHRPDIKSGIFGYAFESPRCLKVKKKYRFLWDNLKVIRCNNDIVSHCPPKFLGYTDLGTMIKIKGDTRLVKKFLPKCIKSHFPQVVLDGLYNE